MAMTTNDTEVMRTSASVFAENSNAFTEEAGRIKSTLMDISAALEKVSKEFDTNNSNVAGYAAAVSTATEQMEAVWESGAATAFEESFTQFKKAMLDLSAMLKAISGDFDDIKAKIEDLVNNNVLNQVKDYASECLINSGNLTEYANAEDENQAALARAYGQGQ